MAKLSDLPDTGRTPSARKGEGEAPDLPQITREGAGTTYLVIGAGGTGGCIGGYLADAGRDVTLVARGKHLEAIRRDGLVLHGTRRGELRVRVPACTAGEFTGRADVIFVCVKGYSVEEILPLVERA